MIWQLPLIQRSKKYVNHVTHFLSCADINIFSPEISNICHIKKYRYRLHFLRIISNSFNLFFIFFFWEGEGSLQAVLIKMVGLYKIKILWNKLHHNFCLRRGLNYIVNVAMWPKFGNSTISMKEVIISSILYGFDLKNQFFWGVLLVQVQ